MNLTTLLLILLPVALVIAVVAFIRHQLLLRDRAWMMREALRNRDFQFRLPTRGLFFGERALQQTLNDMGQDISLLVAQNEVESWQRLTRVLTHEIMNATAPIQCISQTYLSDPDIKGTRYEEGIRAIHKTSTGLSSFVSSYRLLTQLQRPVLTPVPLRPFIQSIATLYSQLAWSVSIPEDMVLKADENLLHQVFVNLAKNAVEAEARHIDVRLERDALCISNDGQPIPPDVRREIFVPFFTTKRTGSGIGLSLSRQVLMTQGMTLMLADIPISGYTITFEIKGIDKVMLPPAGKSR